MLTRATLYIGHCPFDVVGRRARVDRSGRPAGREMRGHSGGDGLSRAILEVEKLAGGVELKEEIFARARHSKIDAAVFELQLADQPERLPLDRGRQAMRGAGSGRQQQAMVDAVGILDREFGGEDRVRRPP